MPGRRQPGLRGRQRTHRRSTTRSHTVLVQIRHRHRVVPSATFRHLCRRETPPAVEPAAGAAVLGAATACVRHLSSPAARSRRFSTSPPELRRGPQWRHLKQHLGGLNISSPSLSAIAPHRRGRVGDARRSFSHRQAAPTSSPSSAALAAAPGVGAGAKMPTRVSSPRSPSERCIAATASSARRQRVRDGCGDRLD